MRHVPPTRAATTEAAVSQAAEEDTAPVELLTSDQSDQLLRIRHSVRRVGWGVGDGWVVPPLVIPTPHVFTHTHSTLTTHTTHTVCAYHGHGSAAVVSGCQGHDWALD